MPASEKQNTDGCEPQELAPRRSTRSGMKRASVANNSSKGTSTTKSKCYGRIITEYFAHRSSETRKRKNNEQTEQANKCVHTDIQTGVPVEGHDSSAAPSEATRPSEQGKLPSRHEQFRASLSAAIDTHPPAVMAKTIARKAPSRPSLSLDSGDEGEDGQISGLLTCSLPRGRLLTA